MDLTGQFDPSVASESSQSFRSANDEELGSVDISNFETQAPFPLRGIFYPTLPDGTVLANILADVTEEEHQTDTLEITDHPVEYGASIVDHAFKRPAELILRLGWSNSYSFNNPATDAHYSEKIYNQLLTLQTERAIFTVFTGNRVYDSMLCQSIMTQADYKTANSLQVTMMCKQVILVNTQTIQIPKTTTTNPQAYASPMDAGQKTALPSTPISKTPSGAKW